MLEGDGFLAIDEVDGAVYKVPMESLAVVLHPAMRLEQRRWENTFVNSCKDSTCFVNAETIAWTCNQKHPCLVFKSVSNDVYVYAHNVEVFSQTAKLTILNKLDEMSDSLRLVTERMRQWVCSGIVAERGECS